MEKKLGVYKLDFDCDRSGSLGGVFVAQKNHVDILVQNKIEVYFGDVLGKHSQVVGSIDEDEIVLLSDDPTVVSFVLSHELYHGFNPFEYEVINHERIRFNGMTLINVVRILEVESIIGDSSL